MGDHKFLVKIGGSPLRGGVHRKGGKHCFSLVMYDFVAVMLFTQQVSHLECLLLFQIESQPGIAYISDAYLKKHLKVLPKAEYSEKI